jgi:hypothetical protein
MVAPPKKLWVTPQDSRGHVYGIMAELWGDHTKLNYLADESSLAGFETILG